MNKKVLSGHVLALLTNIIWGSTFVATKVLLEDFIPIEILFYRFLIGYFFLWVLHPKPLRIDNWRLEITFAAAGLMGICLNYLCESIALLYTGAAIVSVIVAASPFMVGLLAKCFLRQKLQKYFTVGFILSIIGISLVCLTGNADVELHWLGQLLALGACFTWALYGLFSEAINQQNFSAIQVTRRLFMYGLLSVLPLYLIYGDPGSVRQLTSPVNLGNILYLGLGACVLAFIMWNYSIRVLGTVTANVYVYLLPVFTIIISVIVLDEKITPLMILGTILTLVGVALSEWKTEKDNDNNEKQPAPK